MAERSSCLGRGCLALALVVVTPFIAVGLVALAGIALGAFTVSLPFLFVLALVALAVAVGALLVLFAVRRLARRRERNEGIQDSPA